MRSVAGIIETWEGVAIPIANIRSLGKFHMAFRGIGQANRCDSLPNWSEPRPFSMPIPPWLAHLGRSVPVNR